MSHDSEEDRIRSEHYAIMARLGTSSRASKMIFQSPPWSPEAFFCRILFDHISGRREHFGMRFFASFLKPAIRYSVLKKIGRGRLLPELEPNDALLSQLWLQNGCFNSSSQRRLEALLGNSQHM